MIIRAAFTFILAFLSSATSAEARSCIIPPTLSERLADGDAVVRGHVVEFKEISETLPRFPFGTGEYTSLVFRYRVIVTQSVNYSVGCELIVEAGSSNCSGRLPMDRSFVLVFQQGEDQPASPSGFCPTYREAPADWDVFFRDHEAAAYIEGSTSNSSNPERPLCHGLMNLMN